MTSSVDPSLVPAATPPPGVPYDHMSPDTQWHGLLATVIVCLFITVPWVLVRLFTKIRIIDGLEYEDYVLVAAQIFLTNYMILLLVQPLKGAHIWEISQADYTQFLWWANLNIFMYLPASLVAKWANILQLERIFTVQYRSAFWWSVRVFIWCNIIFDVVMFFVEIFQCVPREKIWHPEVPGRCSNVEATLLALASFGVITNLALLLLPLIAIRKLHMSRKKKIAASLIFSVNILAATCSAIRIGYSVIFLRSKDPTWDIIPLADWAVGELSCLIFATTFPTLAVFFRWLRNKSTGNAEAQRPDPSAVAAINRTSLWSPRQISQDSLESPGLLDVELTPHSPRKGLAHPG